MKKIIFLCLATLLGSAISCTSDSAEDDIMEEITPPPATSGEVTYEADVKSIIDANCLGCHSNPPQRGAPMSLVTFDDMRRNSGSSADRMKNERNPMPPAGTLGASTVQVIDDWIADGLKER